MRFGKHKECGGEFVYTEAWGDHITELTCKKCGFSKEVSIIPKWKRELISEFSRRINNEKDKSLFL